MYLSKIEPWMRRCGGRRNWGWEWMNGWRVNGWRVNGWMGEWGNGGMGEWVNGRKWGMGENGWKWGMAEGLNGWMGGWMGEWLNGLGEWVNVNGWMGECEWVNGWMWLWTYANTMSGFMSLSLLKNFEGVLPISSVTHKKLNSVAVLHKYTLCDWWLCDCVIVSPTQWKNLLYYCRFHNLAVWFV
jgi:hypothetical protein